MKQLKPHQCYSTSVKLSMRLISRQTTAVSKLNAEWVPEEQRNQMSVLLKCIPSGAATGDMWFRTTQNMVLGGLARL